MTLKFSAYDTDGLKLKDLKVGDTFVTEYNSTKQQVNFVVARFASSYDRDDVAELVNGQIPVFDLNTNTIRQFSPETPVRKTEITATVKCV